MGSFGKMRTAGMYERLLKLYPQSFQSHYAQAMRQTFDDLLEAEPTQLGRFRIWLRAVANVPISAAKEHLTQGKELPMNRNTKFIVTAVFAALLLANAGSFWFGILHARQHITIENASAVQLADAMQQDNFYYKYGSSAVIFSATVAGVSSQHGATQVAFATGRSYSLTCQFSKPVAAKSGQTISVIAPGGSADRQPHGVLLHDCVEQQ